MFGDILRGVLDWGLEQVEKKIADERRKLSASLGPKPQGSAALRRQEAEALARARQKPSVKDVPHPWGDDDEDDFTPGGTD